MSSLYLVKYRKYHVQQQQHVYVVSEHEIAFISSPTKTCLQQLPYELTKLSNIHGSRKQKGEPPAEPCLQTLSISRIVRVLTGPYEFGGWLTFVTYVLTIFIDQV